MIKVKVTKNIMRKGTVAAGLTMKQIIIGIIGLLSGLGILALFWGKININILMSLVFLIILLVIGFGVIQIQGMSLFKFLWLGFKGPDKRPFHVKGVFSNASASKKE